MNCFWSGFFSAILTSVVAAAIVVASGAVNFAATIQPSRSEQAIVRYTVSRSIALRVSETENAFLNGKRAIELGRHHFADTCLACHGALGVEPKEL